MPSVRLRRGTTSQWSASNPILKNGEIGIDSVTKKFRIGDGVTHYADLKPFAPEAESSGGGGGGSNITPTMIRNYAAQLLDHDNHQGIEFTYNQVAQILTATVTVSGGGGEVEDVVVFDERFANVASGSNANTSNTTYSSFSYVPTSGVVARVVNSPSYFGEKSVQALATGGGAANANLLWTPAEWAENYTIKAAMRVDRAPGVTDVNSGAGIFALQYDNDRFITVTITGAGTCHIYYIPGGGGAESYEGIFAASDWQDISFRVRGDLVTVKVGNLTRTFNVGGWNLQSLVGEVFTHANGSKSSMGPVSVTNQVMGPGGGGDGDSYTDEQARDASSQMFTHGGHEGIQFEYDPESQLMLATVEQARQNIYFERYGDVAYDDDPTTANTTFDEFFQDPVGSPIAGVRVAAEPSYEGEKSIYAYHMDPEGLPWEGEIGVGPAWFPNTNPSEFRVTSKAYVTSVLGAPPIARRNNGSAGVTLQFLDNSYVEAKISSNGEAVISLNFTGEDPQEFTASADIDAWHTVMIDVVGSTMTLRAGTLAQTITLPTSGVTAIAGLVYTRVDYGVGYLGPIAVSVPGQAGGACKVVVLGASDSVPEGTPAGSVIFRRS